MNTIELKHLLLNHIDSLEKNRLQELYGVLMNYINGQKEINDWELLTDNEKQGIVNAIKEIDDGKGIPHEAVMSEFKERYSNG